MVYTNGIIKNNWIRWLFTKTWAWWIKKQTKNGEASKASSRRGRSVISSPSRGQEDRKFTSSWRQCCRLTEQPDRSCAFSWEPSRSLYVVDKRRILKGWVIFIVTHPLVSSPIVLNPVGSPRAREPVDSVHKLQSPQAQTG